jgi:hypothetical protein
LLRLPVDKNATFTLQDTAIFTQNISNDWHIKDNWDTGKVPNSCTLAIIPTSKECFINAGRKARAYRLVSETGSVFDAESGVVLEVEN